MNVGDAYAGCSSDTMPDGGGRKYAPRRRIGGPTARPRPDHFTAHSVRYALPGVLYLARRMRTRPKRRLLDAPPIQSPRTLPQRVTRPRAVRLLRRRRSSGVELAHGCHQAVASRAAPQTGELPPPAALFR